MQQLNKVKCTRTRHYWKTIAVTAVEEFHNGHVEWCIYCGSLRVFGPKHLSPLDKVKIETKH